MAISQFPASAAGGGRPDTVFAPGLHSVDVEEGYYILEVVGDVSGDGSTLSNGFQKLPAISSLNVGVELVGTSWSGGSSGLSGNGEAAAFGDGVFMVADGDNVRRSFSLGAAFQSSISGISGDAVALAYGNGLWLVGGNELRTSSDNGDTWTLIGSIPSYTIAYGNNLYVSISISGDVFTSNDGVNFTFQLGLSILRPALAFGNGVFVAVGEDGNVFVTSDGINWATGNSGTTEDLSAITFGDGLFLAAGRPTRAYRSSDGLSWSSSFTGQSFAGGVAFSDGVYLITGGLNALNVSTDLISWTRYSAPDSENWGPAAGGDGAFVTIDESNSGNTAYSAEQVDANAALLLTELPTAIEAGE